MNARLIRSVSLGFLGLCSCGAYGATLNVECGSPISRHPTIASALKALPHNGEPHTILVSGTCNESVSIGTTALDNTAPPAITKLPAPANFDRPDQVELCAGTDILRPSPWTRPARSGRVSSAA